MDHRAVIIASCWFAVAIISSVYMWVFGSKLGDIMFGVFLPIGLLVLVAIIVTFQVVPSFKPGKKREAKSSSDLQDLRSKLDLVTKEIEQIKRARYEIYVMNADGSGQTRPTYNSYWDGTCSWSPDGTKITFLSDRDGNDEIYTMNPDGSGQTRLTYNTASDIIALSWELAESKENWEVPLRKYACRG